MRQSGHDMVFPLPLLPGAHPLPIWCRSLPLHRAYCASIHMLHVINVLSSSNVLFQPCLVLLQVSYETAVPTYFQQLLRLAR